MVDQYSIKDLEIISGIKSHTLRIWEQRYALLVPARTETNIRYYSGNQLRELLNICVLYNNGFKISQIAKLDPSSIAREVTAIIKDEPSVTGQVDILVIAMVELDEIRFQHTLHANISTIGVSATVEGIIFPFLRKIGFMWQTGAINPAQEHFVSNLIRQKIISEIDKFPPTDSSIRGVLFLPEHEMHELSILYYLYLCKKAGIKCFYLGQSTPYEDLLDVLEYVKPNFILTVLTQPMKDVSTTEYISKIASSFPETTIIASGAQVYFLDSPESDNVVFFKSSAELNSILENGLVSLPKVN